MALCYEHLGYAAPASGGVPMTDVIFLPSPPAPSSVAAAMSSEVFTPYAALGAADNDGLAPASLRRPAHRVHE